MGLSGEEFGIKGIWLMKRPESVMEGLGFVDGWKMDGVRLLRLDNALYPHGSLPSSLINYYV